MKTVFLMHTVGAREAVSKRKRTERINVHSLTQKECMSESDEHTHTITLVYECHIKLDVKDETT